MGIDLKGLSFNSTVMAQPPKVTTDKKYDTTILDDYPLLDCNVAVNANPLIDQAVLNNKTNAVYLVKKQTVPIAVNLFGKQFALVAYVTINDTKANMEAMQKHLQSAEVQELIKQAKAQIK